MYGLDHDDHDHDDNDDEVAEAAAAAAVARLQHEQLGLWPDAAVDDGLGESEDGDGDGEEEEPMEERMLLAMVVERCEGPRLAAAYLSALMEMHAEGGMDLAAARSMLYVLRWVVDWMNDAVRRGPPVFLWLTHLRRPPQTTGTAGGK